MGPKSKKSGSEQQATGKAKPDVVKGKVEQKSKSSSKAPPAAESESKAARKQRMAEYEKRRRQEVDDMMEMKVSNDGYEDDACDYSYDGEYSSSAPSSKTTVDSFGNTIAKAKKAQDEKLEIMRKEARERREAKEKLKLEQQEVEQLQRLKISDGDVLEKPEKAVRITRREKKAMQSEKDSSNAPVRNKHDVELDAFSLSIQAGRYVESDDDGSSSGATLSATDVIIPCFSISAPLKPLLLNASLRLVNGRRYGLMGSNGSGKSTILKFLAAKRLPVPPKVDVLLVEQEVMASSEPVFQQVLNADTRRSALLMEESVLMTDFLRHDEEEEGEDDVWSEDEWGSKVARFVALGEELEACGADACEAKVRRILTGLGFSEAQMDGPSTSLSGGWRMRVSLAQALFMEPKLLLLDEPTNHLDLNAVLWLDEYLSTQWKETILIVSHDADFLDSVCTDIIHLDSCLLNYYSGSYARFEGMRHQIESKKDRDYKHQQKVLKDVKSANGSLTQEKLEKKAMKQLNVERLLEKPKEYRVKFNLDAGDESEHGSCIGVHQLGFAYAEQPQLFTNLSFGLHTDTRVAIVGPNGCGKTTLMKLLTGALQACSGEVQRNNRIRIGSYNQHFEELLPYNSTPISFLTATYAITEIEARKYLGMFGLDGARHCIRIEQLSGGQKSRVVFASLSLAKPHLLLLDEPTNHLDMESVEALIEALNVYKGGVVLISHDARLIHSAGCELWVCGEGVTGLRVESRGFDKYRRDVHVAMDNLQRITEAKVKVKADLRKAERLKRAAKQKAAHAK